MKDQYFGDASDFVKYGALRRFSSSGLSVFVSWMLTAPDGRTDGRHIDYLRQPDRYRPFDPVLFDLLGDAVSSGRRAVGVAAELDLIPGAQYQDALLEDTGESRRAYFAETVVSSASSDLVFFDPDNGLEVPSAMIGRRGSSKYMYWSELSHVYSAGRSVVVYQHFPRVERSRYLSGVCRAVAARLGARAFVLQASRVAFVVIPVAGHWDDFFAIGSAVAQHWSPLMRLFEPDVA